MEDFDAKIENLDLKLFETIHSQTSDNDRQSLLACQKAVRALVPGYIFLEIGSYVGGSLQPYVLDESCRKIYSLDKRPEVAADERGDVIYRNNTTEFMLENLKKLSGANTEKIQCIDGDVSEIDKGKIEEKPHLCFIDGEHTDDAAWRDFQFCFDVLDENGAILFHDAPIIYHALSRIIQHLKDEKIKFRAYNLPNTVFVIEFGDFPLHQSASINEMLLNNHVGYLNSLHFNDGYRNFANRRLFRFVRALKAKITKSNVTK